LGLAAFFLRSSHEDPRDTESSAAKISVQGDRYPEQLEKMTGH
jgi:hypothetical protein